MGEEEAKEVGVFLLEAGALLMGSGANTNRIRLTIKRIASHYGFQVDFLITHRAILLNLRDAEGNFFFNRIKHTYAIVPNFRLLSGISTLSWRIVDEDLSLPRAWEELKNLKSVPKYPRVLVLAMVALACASFCRLAGGNGLEMGVVFLASFAGLFVRQELHKRKSNAFVGVFLAAWGTTMISGGLCLLLQQADGNTVLVTSVLYLIPGIPLINSVSDMLEGYSLNGFTRALNGFLVSFAIALGLAATIFIYNLG